MERETKAFAEREEFFSAEKAKAMVGEAEIGEGKLVALVSRDIVEVIAAELLADEDESRGRALSMLKLQGASGDGDGAIRDQDRRSVIIESRSELMLTLNCIAAGASLRLASEMIKGAKRCIDVAELGYCDEAKRAMRARVACAANLQRISDALSRSWALAVALDSSSKSGSRLDARFRAHVEGEIRNFHLLAIPLGAGRAGEHMHRLLCKLMDAALAGWRKRAIGVSTDGANGMTGSNLGASARLEREALPGFYRAWRASHQLNLIAQKAITELLDEKFICQLTSLISHLRRQQTLAFEIGSKRPRYAGARWLSAGAAVKWLLTNRIRVCDYLEERNPPRKPPPHFWASLFGLFPYIEEIDRAPRRLQGKSAALPQQKAILDDLSVSLSEMAGAKGPLSEEEMLKASRKKNAARERHTMPYAELRGHLEDQDACVISALEAMPLTGDNAALNGLAKMHLRAISKISELVAERDSASDPGAPLPATLPQPLMRIKGRDFHRALRNQRDRLRNSFSPKETQEIGEERNRFLQSVKDEAVLKEALSSCEKAAGFQESWQRVGNRFLKLRSFIGGLATAFPGASAVEADFSVIKREKSDHRMQLTDFSLEGILRAKQFDALLQTSKALKA